MEERCLVIYGAVRVLSCLTIAPGVAFGNPAQQQGEGAAAADFTLHCQAAAHPYREVSTDRQPEADTLMARRRQVPVDLHERVEHPRELIGRNTPPGIADCDPCPIVIDLAEKRYRAAAVRELDRVRQEVEQDLPGLVGIRSPPGPASRSALR